MSQRLPGPVAIIGADSPIGLTVMRELGERGVEVIALGKTADSIGRWSRFASSFQVMPDGPLAGWLPQWLRERRVAAVMGIAEHHLLQLAELKGSTGDCRLLCPDTDKLELVLDKQRTLELAARVGIAVPSSWLPAPGEDFAAIAAGLSWPVAIKWPDPNLVSERLAAHGLALEKVEYASDADALLRILHRYDALGVWPLVQSWCPGQGLGQMLHMHDGAATLRFQHRRLREWPPTGGVSSFCEAVPLDRHRAQMKLSERLLAEMGWEGPAMVEYRHDPETGTYWLMEVNGRFWGSIPLAWHCGAHFAWEVYRCQMLGEGGEARTRLKMHKARYAIPDGKHFLAVLRDGKRSPAERAALALRFLAGFLDPRVRYFVWTLRDPMPLIGDMLAIIRKSLRRQA